MDLFESVLTIIENIEREYPDEVGRRKKEVALEIIKTVVTTKWGLNYYEKFRETIQLLIDLFCSISKKEIVLHLNETRRTYFPCL